MKTPLSIQIIYWLANIAFWLMVLIATVLFILNLIFLTDVFTDTIQLRIQMPVPIEVVEEGKLFLSDAVQTVRIEEAYGKLYLVDTPFYITKMVTRVLFIVVLLGLFMTWRFKQFITNIKKGLLFESENIKNLKQIAYGLLALWLSTKIYMEVIYRALIKYLDFDSIIIGEYVNNYNGLLIFSIALWALAHVFVKGLEMKEEQNLTI